MSTVNIPGISYPFPGQSLVISPLSLGDLEQLLDQINAIVAGWYGPGQHCDGDRCHVRGATPQLPGYVA
ncbi:hypothetical protein [Pseudomonas fluorescens]|uniref:hypothetical protein n=1 Tax=Pseudomonas fluorescens TaxID=294 RepID=UPI001787381C|nr:hypothetical protein [Pseudomonas fluorescens]